MKPPVIPANCCCDLKPFIEQSDDDGWWYVSCGKACVYEDSTCDRIAWGQSYEEAVEQWNKLMGSE